MPEAQPQQKPSLLNRLKDSWNKTPTLMKLAIGVAVLGGVAIAATLTAGLAAPVILGIGGAAIVVSSGIAITNDAIETRKSMTGSSARTQQQTKQKGKEKQQEVGQGLAITENPMFAGQTRRKDNAIPLEPAQKKIRTAEEMEQGMIRSSNPMFDKKTDIKLDIPAQPAHAQSSYPNFDKSNAARILQGISSRATITGSSVSSPGFRPDTPATTPKTRRATSARGFGSKGSSQSL